MVPICENHMHASGPHTYLHKCIAFNATISIIKICNIIFSKFIRFGSVTLPLKRNYKTDTTATLEKKISDWNSCRNICKCITATTNAYNTCVGCFQYFAFRELARRCTNVLSKTKSTRTRQGPLSPNGSQVLRRLQYNTLLILVQAGG